MLNTSLSPIEKIFEKRRAEKELSAKIYENIFDLGVYKTAELFEITPEETVKLIIKTARKKNEIERLQDLSDRKKISKICERIMELQTYSADKIYEECKDFAQIWEILIAKCVLKLKMKQELIENG